MPDERKRCCAKRLQRFVAAATRILLFLLQMPDVRERCCAKRL
jgi:hypothetical protein